MVGQLSDKGVNQVLGITVKYQSMDCLTSDQYVFQVDLSAPPLKT